jgi:hypothetical protein
MRFWMDLGSSGELDGDEDRLCFLVFEGDGDRDCDEDLEDRLCFFGGDEDGEKDEDRDEDLEDRLCFLVLEEELLPLYKCFFEELSLLCLE